MSDKEKEILERIGQNLKHMEDEDKIALVERADGMAYMNRKWKKRQRETEDAGTEKSVKVRGL